MVEKERKGKKKKIAKKTKHQIQISLCPAE
jgi:hypothetical protein